MASKGNKRTPLYDFHVELGAKIVAFADYAMPVQYPTGILTEHNHTRDAAGLFDVSHMGQVTIRGADPITALETLVPADIRSLPIGGMRYTMLTNEQGGILDDLIVTRLADGIGVIVNAACKDADLAHLRAQLGSRCDVELDDDRALLALQGPKAAVILDRLVPGVAELSFMTVRAFDVAGSVWRISRSGYTGEDGFEISLPGGEAANFARRLLEQPDVAPIGLGARDSLRLEAGLCLYGHDIDETTTPVEAGLRWTIGKRRRDEANFPGAPVVLAQISQGPKRRRIGIRPDGPAPAREGTVIEEESGKTVGQITSGGFGPAVGGPVAMGYVESSMAEEGCPLGLVVRGKRREAHVIKLPFVPHKYIK